jgi:hypothetical protein
LRWDLFEIIAAGKLVEHEANPALSSKDLDRHNDPTKQATPRISSLDDKQTWVMEQLVSLHRCVN